MSLLLFFLHAFCVVFAALPAKCRLAAESTAAELQLLSESETYNIHESQDVLLDVPAAVVAHHHLVRHH